MKPFRYDRKQEDKKLAGRKARLSRRAKLRRITGKTAVKGAQNRLRQFRQASLIAVALTAFLILLLNPGEARYSQEQGADTIANGNILDTTEPVGVGEAISGDKIREATKNEALETIRNLRDGFFSNLPKILVAIAVLVFAWVLARFFRFVLQKTLGRWSSSGAVIAMTSISIWLIAAGTAVSVLAGDIRALVGSLGLVGLALSWSLQTPIESFTGWLLNSFKRYYVVGDRIQVGEIFGDVYKIDFLTTTVWEIGGPYRQGFVMAEQPTGRMVTFPNNEILTGSVVNLTGDFPFVWDELNIAVGSGSDVRYAMEVALRTATELVGENMKIPAQQYEKILRQAGIDAEVAEGPQVYAAGAESWSEIIVRYLVEARERRKWKSELTIRLSEELAKPENKEKIKEVSTRSHVRIV